MDINTALRIWTFDNGYRTINSFLIDSNSRTDYKYHIKNNKTLEHDGHTYNTRDIVNVLKNNMFTSDKPETYYRGGNQKLNYSTFKKSFISVTKDEEQARAFMDDDTSCLYKITVDANVNRCNTGVEHEVLLENNLYWNYLGHEKNYYLIRISKTPIEINMDTILKQELTNEELRIFFDEYKEEANDIGDEITPKGFVDFIQYYIKHTDKHNISLEKANEWIEESNAPISGKKNKTIKRTKPKKSKKSKRVCKNKSRKRNRKS